MLVRSMVSTGINQPLSVLTAAEHRMRPALHSKRLNHAVRHQEEFVRACNNPHIHVSLFAEWPHLFVRTQFRNQLPLLPRQKNWHPFSLDRTAIGITSALENRLGI